MSPYFIPGGVPSEIKGEFASYKVELSDSHCSVFEINENGKTYIGVVFHNTVSGMPQYTAVYTKSNGWMSSEGGGRLTNLINWIISQREIELRSHYESLRVV